MEAANEPGFSVAPSLRYSCSSRHRPRQEFEAALQPLSAEYINYPRCIANFRRLQSVHHFVEWSTVPVDNLAINSPIVFVEHLSGAEVEWRCGYSLRYICSRAADNNAIHEFYPDKELINITGNCARRTSVCLLPSVEWEWLADGGVSSLDVGDMLRTFVYFYP
jgi:hypothetical protein